MSRAFVRENDGSEVPEDVPERPISEHPNFVTERGLRLINERIRELEEARQRAKASEDKVTLATLERDLRYWQQRKASAKLVQPEPNPTKVRFGIRAIVQLEDGEERSYALVGEDEADPAHGLISWISPIAQALLGAQVGDEVNLQGQRAEVVRLEPVS